MVIRACSRAQKLGHRWCEDFSKESAIAFLKEMAHGGGAPVFPDEPETLSATSYICDALVNEAESVGKWAEGVPVEKIRAFVRSCYREGGGFAFSPMPAFHANVACTRFGVRIRDDLLRLDSSEDVITESEISDTVAFVERLFDEKSGGFHGYPRPAESPSRAPGFLLKAPETTTDPSPVSPPQEERNVGMRRQNPQTDLQWFYANLAKARSCSTEYVAVEDCKIVGSGTAIEAVVRAAENGARDPILLRVPPEKSDRAFLVGL